MDNVAAMAYLGVALGWLALSGVDEMRKREVMTLVDFFFAAVALVMSFAYGLGVIHVS